MQAVRAPSCTSTNQCTEPLRGENCTSLCVSLLAAETWGGLGQGVNSAAAQATLVLMTGVGTDGHT